MLAPGLGGEGGLLEGEEGGAGRAEGGGVLQHQVAVQVESSGEMAGVVLVCGPTVNYEELTVDQL